MKPKLLEKWEDRFDKKFGEELVFSNWLDCPCCGRPEHKIKDTDIPVKQYWFYEPIKDFIRSLLKELKEEVEGMEKEFYGVDGLKIKSYNQACDDVLSKLNQMIEGK